MQWYGVAKDKDTGVWFTNYNGIKHLVHGVKPSLYEGFPTEQEAKDFVRYHRDHHEGSKQKSARKASAAAAAAQPAPRPVPSPITTPEGAGGAEFVATPHGGVATPGPHSEPDTSDSDRNFIKRSSESDSGPPALDDDDYEPGDSEFEDSSSEGDDEDAAADAARKMAEAEAYHRGMEAAVKEIARQRAEEEKRRRDKEEEDLRRAQQNSREEVAGPNEKKT